MSKLHLLFLAIVTYNSIAYANQAALQVLPETDGVTIESRGSLYWLHFDADADSLWPTLKNFWATEGIALKQVQPKLGFMETEWTKDMETNTLLTILLSDQAPVRRERFRLRLERLPDNKGTRVFINHSGYGILFQEEAVYTGYLTPSPELEIEMLTRLALYSGADTEQPASTTQTAPIAQAAPATKTAPIAQPAPITKAAPVAQSVPTTKAAPVAQSVPTTKAAPVAQSAPAAQTVSPFITAPIQAISINDSQYEITLPGSLEFIRNKLVRALDRMNMEITDETSKTITAKVTIDATLKEVDDPSDWDIDDDSDLEEEGFSDYRNKPTGDSKPDTIVYILDLIVDESRVTIRISSHADNTDDGLGLSRFSRVLARNL